MNFGTFRPDRVVRAVQRWALVIVAGGAIAALTSFAVSKILPAEYQAEAELYIAPAATPTVAFQDVVLGTNVARSYVQLLMADVVLRPVMEEMHWDDIKSFKEHARAAQVRDTSIITVSFRDGDPRRAADIANAIARSFIAQSKTLQSTLQGTTVTQLETQIRSIEEDIASLDGQITSLRASLAATPRPGQTADPAARGEMQAQLLTLDSSRQTKQQTLAQLLKTRDDMRLAAVRAESTVSLWDPALPPEQAVAPRVGLNTALGGLAGILVTFLIVLGLSYIDDRVTELEDVEPRLGIAPLGQVHLGLSPETLSGKLYVRDEPRSPEAEAFRSIRTNLQFAGVDKRPKILVVTSALPREGKSVVSANLALAFAQAGSRTILIDADLRRPSQHRIFGVSAAVGLTSLLTESASISQISRLEVAPQLIVVPSGPLPPNPSELLSSARMGALLTTLQRLTDDVTIIIDTSPVLAAADAVGLATKADGAIVVVDSARTHTIATIRTVEALKRVRANVLGAVLNKVSSAEAGYYYYKYSLPRVNTAARADGRRPG